MPHDINQNYILITPAYNEEKNISSLFSSVLKQTILPHKWIIINDGSTDTTENILSSLKNKHRCIHIITIQRETKKTYYNSKILAFNKGLDLITASNYRYSFIGNLDADIVLSPNYYESMIYQFKNNNNLGIVGGSYRYQDGTTDIWGGNYIPGSILFFRKQCFKEIEGYRPLRYGAEDTLACIMAEQKGWDVKYLAHHYVTQKRMVGAAGHKNLLYSRFYQGISEYDIGYHPLFSLLKFFKRAPIEKPIIISSLSRFLGYIYGHFLKEETLVPKEAKKHLQQKQLTRMSRVIS